MSNRLTAFLFFSQIALLLTGHTAIGQSASADCPEFTTEPEAALRQASQIDDYNARVACLGGWAQLLQTGNYAPATFKDADNAAIGRFQNQVMMAKFGEQFNQSLESDVSTKKSQDDFKNLGFGIGVGYSFGSGGARVEEAKIVNDVVRITSDNTDQARVLLEAHWFFSRKTTPNFGFGPFASINTGGTENAIGSFAMGIMFGFRDKNDKSKSSWNVGIGYVMDDDVEVLGDGLVADQPLPEGETEIRLKKESKGGLLVLFSRGF